MPAIKSINDLFVHELSDIYSAEKQLTRALPKMARAATDKKLIAALESHLEETRGQIERIDKILEITDGLRLKRMKCHAMEGLVEETQEIIDSVEAGSLRDEGLIAAAQKVEHYEIASYGTLRTLAEKLGFHDAAKLLDETLKEEKQTDKKLTAITEKNSR